MMHTRFKTSQGMIPAAASLLALMLMMNGCVRKQDNLPLQDVLPDSVMVQMLTDMFLAEGVMIQLEYLQAKESRDAVPYYAEIYKKYDTNRETFTTSMEFYAQDPERLDRIYDMVVQKLAVLQDEQRKE
ncbi:MAG: DUF4296 domain-containing protein [Bacteroidales bacterium]